MRNKKQIYTRWLLITALVFLLNGYIHMYALGEGKPLVLQEMTWTDVQEYLKTGDMVIIPLGSTEQHGPHLPLGTDFYEALEGAKMISARTGVVVAPVLMAGYSVYHSGFPGTLSLKPETMARVLVETAEMLIKYGFHRIMFFNYHGGNTVVESMAIHRINHTTKAVAVRIGIGAPFFEREELPAPFDFHSGIGETSVMLYLKPELVKMERAKKPTLLLNPKMKELWELSRKDPALAGVFSAMLATPVETGKGGASHEISDNGIWTTGDPKTASSELGKKWVEQSLEGIVKFIEAWKRVKNK
jgi:creatinine amidohydrolase/Fe(II)-dependent formamide hydrolase-like protein